MPLIKVHKHKHLLHLLQLQLHSFTTIKSPTPTYFNPNFTSTQFPNSLPHIKPHLFKMFFHKLLCSLLFLLILAGVPFSDASELHVPAPENATTTEMTMVPWIEPGKDEIMKLVLTDSRRKLGSFKICSLCTCCSGGGGVGGRGYCVPSPCCYAINCNIPNRPFGFCSFTPKTCNCFNCHL